METTRVGQLAGPLANQNSKAEAKSACPSTSHVPLINKNTEKLIKEKSKKLKNRKNRKIRKNNRKRNIQKKQKNRKKSGKKSNKSKTGKSEKIRKKI